MTELEIKAYCNRMAKAKGCSVEIDDYQVRSGSISFKVRLLKRGLKAVEPITLFTNLHLENQLDTRFGSILATV